MTSGLDIGEFPLSSSRVPDVETQAKSFLTKYPEADGRGIVIAVMDTGCDPGAPGLRVTTEGLPKIIDCIDCTGSGDVDTSTVVEAAVDDTSIENVHTGRRLTLGSGKAWKNPTGRWHVGAKKAYELYDSELVKRVQKERGAFGDEDHRRYIAEALRNLSNFDLVNPRPQGEAIRMRKDLEERISQLSALEKARDDPGAILDVVAWHDGRLWRAAIGSKLDGNMTDSPPLASFAAERKFDCLGELEQMNYCLNVYDEGCVVSIVCDISSHGTHVAGICAACHPDEPARNGVAPGAQIVALKIGDTRLDAMETGTGLARAFAHCVKAKVDLINLSFGEGASPCAIGRVVELAQRVVQQHGITFVTSAGNEGPGLTTIGAPGHGSDSFVTVGAHVSPPAMEAQYSMLEKLASTPYTWTSRGPTQDGSLGVAVCAPGSAITCIPNWTLSGAQLMNGTSMAAPNACGCLALVSSALKAAATPYSPASILRGVKASALPLPSADPFAVGAGMIQVENCYEHMMAHKDVAYQDVAFVVSVPGRGRGIYLREPNEISNQKTFNVRIDPHYRELDSKLNRSKIELELNVALVSSATWIKAPPFVVLPAAGRMISVNVDPSSLSQGDAHLGFVSGFDAARPNIGPLFKIPVTVIRAVPPTCCPLLQEPAFIRKDSVRCSPGSLHRTFVAVPAGCTWAEFTVTTKAFEGQARLMALHVLQDVPHVPGTKTSEEWVMRFTVAGTQKKTLRVEGAGTVEVTLGQYWNCLGDTEADLNVTFHGILPEVTKLALSADNPIASVNVASGPGAVGIKPTASLNTHRISLRPTSAMIQAGGERELYPEGKRVYDLILEYALKLEEDAEVTPQALLLNDRLYESVFEGQMILIYDSNKRYMGCTDAWPTPVKLKKGDYVARLQVRHDDVPLLEKLKTMPLSIDRKLEKTITLKAYPSFNSAITGQGEFGEVKVQGASRKAIFFALALDEKLPDAVKPGDQLVGPMGFGEPSFSVAAKKSRGGYTVTYAVTVPKAEDKKDDAQDDDLRTNSEKLEDAIRDAQIEHLKSLRKWATREEHRSMLSRLLESHPKHLPLHLEKITSLEELKNPDAPKVIDADMKAQESDSIVRAVDTMFDQIDQGGLAVHLGRRVDKEDKKAVQKSKEKDKVKDAVVQGLTKKIIALAKVDNRAQVSSAFKELSLWVDVTEVKHARVMMLYEKALGNLGLALAALNKEIGEEKAPKRELLEERAELINQLGWQTWANQERQSLCMKFPKIYSRF